MQQPVQEAAATIAGPPATNEGVCLNKIFHHNLFRTRYFLCKRSVPCRTDIFPDLADAAQSMNIAPLLGELDMVQNQLRNSDGSPSR